MQGGGRSQYGGSSGGRRTDQYGGSSSGRRTSQYGGSGVKLSKENLDHAFNVSTMNGVRQQITAIEKSIEDAPTRLDHIHNFAKQAQTASEEAERLQQMLRDTGEVLHDLTSRVKEKEKHENSTFDTLQRRYFQARYASPMESMLDGGQSRTNCFIVVVLALGLFAMGGTTSTKYDAIPGATRTLQAVFAGIFSFIFAWLFERLRLDKCVIHAKTYRNVTNLGDFHEEAMALVDHPRARSFLVVVVLCALFKTSMEMLGDALKDSPLIETNGLSAVMNFVVVLCILVVAMLAVRLASWTVYCIQVLFVDARHPDAPPSTFNYFLVRLIPMLEPDDNICDSALLRSMQSPFLLAFFCAGYVGVLTPTIGAAIMSELEFPKEKMPYMQALLFLLLSLMASMLFVLLAIMAIAQHRTHIKNQEQKQHLNEIMYHIWFERDPFDKLLEVIVKSPYTQIFCALTIWIVPTPSLINMLLKMTADYDLSYTCTDACVGRIRENIGLCCLLLWALSLAQLIFTARFRWKNKHLFANRERKQKRWTAAADRSSINRESKVWFFSMASLAVYTGTGIVAIVGDPIYPYDRFTGYGVGMSGQGFRGLLVVLASLLVISSFLFTITFEVTVDMTEADIKNARAEAYMDSRQRKQALREERHQGSHGESHGRMGHRRSRDRGSHVAGGGRNSLTGAQPYMGNGHDYDDSPPSRDRDSHAAPAEVRSQPGKKMMV